MTKTHSDIGTIEIHLNIENRYVKQYQADLLRSSTVFSFYGVDFQCVDRRFRRYDVFLKFKI